MFEKLKSIFKIVNFQGTIQLLDGTQILCDGNVEKGTKVFVSLPNTEEPMVLPDGEYTLEDESIMMVKDGVISDIQPKKETDITQEPEMEQEEQEEMAEPTPTEEPVPTEEPETEVEVEPTDAEKKIVELEDRLKKIEDMLVANGVQLSKIEKIENDFNTLKEKLETTDGATRLSTKQNIVEMTPLDIKLKNIKNRK